MVELDHEQKIVELSDQRAVEFLEAELEGTTPEQRKFMQDQAQFGFRVKHEIKMNERLMRDQQLRAIRLFADPKIRDEYAKLTAAKILPELKARPEKKTA